MIAKDQHGLPLTGASPRAAQLYDAAVETYHCFAGEPFRHLGMALQDSPGFLMGHLIKVYMTAIGTDAPTRALGVQALAAAEGIAGDAREEGHRRAATQLLAGEIRAAGRTLEDIAIAEPRDTVALQAGQLVDFMTGDARMLRDRIARALPAWSADMPGWHAVQAMHAFGLEECGQYAAAEAAGREAVARQPRNNWGQHAVAHVLEMQDRRAEGVAWMTANGAPWRDGSFFTVHNTWHLALFHLGLGQTDEVLALYDAEVWGEGATMAYDLADAAALLWRLRLLGVDVGDRWTPLADAFEAEPRGANPFADAHALMAFTAAGRDAAADRAVAELEAVAGAETDTGRAVRRVALPVARALRDFGRGRFADAADGLRDVRNHAAEFGGSHAQRDVLDLTLLAAARAGGDAALVRALEAERAHRRKK